MAFRGGDREGSASPRAPWPRLDYPLSPDFVNVSICIKHPVCVCLSFKLIA